MFKTTDQSARGGAARPVSLSALSTCRTKRLGPCSNRKKRRIQRNAVSVMRCSDRLQWLLEGLPNRSCGRALARVLWILCGFGIFTHMPLVRAYRSGELRMTDSVQCVITIGLEFSEVSRFAALNSRPARERDPTWQTASPASCGSMCSFGNGTEARLTWPG